MSMFMVAAASLYVLTIALSIWVVIRYHTAWYWHILSVAVAAAVGFAPRTSLLDSKFGSLLYGFVFFLTATWGIVGLIPFRSRRQKAA
jgi:hypothetical protein